MNIDKTITILHIFTAFIVIIVFILMARACFGGIVGFGDQAMTSEQYYSGYILPLFRTRQQAIDWANNTRYEEQWRRLLNTRLFELRLEAQDQYTDVRLTLKQKLSRVSLIMSERDYNEVALRILEKKRRVGSEFQIESVPIKENE